MLDFELPTGARFLAKVSQLKMDTSIGSRNAVWFIPSSNKHTATLRLSFSSTSLVSEVFNTIVSWVSQDKVKITTNACNFVIKKTWTSELLEAKGSQRKGLQKRNKDSMSILASYTITLKSDTAPPPSLTIGTALVFSDDYTSWTLAFDPNKNFQDTLSFIGTLFSVGNNSLKNPSDFLPDIGLDKIKLERVTYSTGPGKRKSITVVSSYHWNTSCLRLIYHQ